MITSLRVARLMGGFRGGPRYDIGAASMLLAGLSELAIDLADGATGIDLNPVMVLPDGQGALVVDWVIHEA